MLALMNIRELHRRVIPVAMITTAQESRSAQGSQDYQLQTEHRDTSTDERRPHQRKLQYGIRSPDLVPIRGSPMNRTASAFHLNNVSNQYHAQ